MIYCTQWWSHWSPVVRRITSCWVSTGVLHAGTIPTEKRFHCALLITCLRSGRVGGGSRWAHPHPGRVNQSVKGVRLSSVLFYSKTFLIVTIPPFTLHYGPSDAASSCWCFPIRGRIIEIKALYCMLDCKQFRSKRYKLFGPRPIWRH